MTSRLDRLFVLLEAGAGAATRRAAARQLGEVQKAHPEELHRLLARLMKHLRSPAWETRVAASQAVEAILANVPEWHPPQFLDVKEENADLEECGRLKCETFDLEKVLQNGEHLMASEGHEYDMDEETLSAADVKERLAKQRQLLNARLGLDVAAGLGVDLSAMYTSEDLMPTKHNTPAKNETVRRPVQEIIQLTPSKQLSSREINLAKRKARQAALTKQKSRDCSDESTSAPPTPPAEPDRKKIKLEPPDDFSGLAPISAATPDVSGAWADSARWPLEWWSGALQVQLLAPGWEARHGAATALRELLQARVHATAAHAHGNTKEQNENAHQEWLEDMALRLLCVLALDRFGDFVSDQVVAPVRETCAQALGVALSHVRESTCRAVAALLARLASHSQWEARHGALLGFKYLLAARQEVAVSVGALEQLVAGLEDSAEDVSGVAAGALAPAAGALVARRAARAAGVVARLWRLLREQDELAAPAHQYMALLAALMALPAAAPLLHPIDLADVLPRLWPYLDHTTSSVRKATLQTMRTLTKPLVTKSGMNGDAAKENRSNGDDNNDKDCLMWTPTLLQDAMRHVYQRVLFEHVHDIQDVAVQVWENLLKYSPLGVTLIAACPVLSTWLCLAMQPSRMPVDTSMLLHQERRPRTTSLMSPDTLPPEVRPNQKWYIGGSESLTTTVREMNVMRARCLAAQVLGYLSCYLVQPAPGIEYKAEDESPIDCYVKVMTVYLKSGSALQRLVCSLVVSAWATATRQHGLYPPHARSDTNGQDGQMQGDMSSLAPPALTSTLQAALNQALYYDEVALNCNRILQEARDLHAMMKHYKLPVDGDEFTNIIRLEQVVHLTTISQPMIATLKSKRVIQTLEERRKSLHTAVNQCCLEQTMWNVSVQAALASACSNLHCVPERLNPVVRPLMASVKRERWPELQAQAAAALAHLARLLLPREPCPNNKILANLKAFLSCDPEFTPRIVPEEGPEEANGDSASGDSGAEGKPEQENETQPHAHRLLGIVSVCTPRAPPAPRRGRPPAAAPCAPRDQARKALQIQRRGATLALTSLTQYFGKDLPEQLPKLWEFIMEPFEKNLDDADLENESVDAGSELISRLQVFEVVCPYIAAELWDTVRTSGVRACCLICRHALTCVRHLAARCLAALAARDLHYVLPILIHQLLPALEEGSDRVRCGAAEAIARVVDALQLNIVPYIVLLVVPLLGRMSDSCEPVRMMSTRCFASLIQLMPLDGAAPPPGALSPDMHERRARDKLFLERLFNPKAIEDYKIPVPISAQLRSYQQAGVNWLRFLYSYKLHGVLCDDMGLGKTLQSVLAVAGSHWERSQARLPELCSLVVCPPTLTGHWVFEVNKFIPANFLKPLQYVGPPIERERLRSQVQHYNLIVASYDIVRKDIDFFSSIKWNYCILDEGHVIKNGKTKAFKAIKMLVANHRLILSGTPIQNNVLELWSLFDFLMPGLLGTERQFTAKYSRPILAARDAKATPLQLQAGALACEALHRQVLPFLLRRVKEDVLKELPPKITQDYYCELSPLQRLLYSHVSTDVSNTQHTHVFQALHYLQSVCNHPKLVLSAAHPAAARVAHSLAAAGSTLDDIHHSAKLPALKQLLLDCGIGVTASDSEPSAVVSQHRALVFCQLKKMLDIVELDLLKKHLPTVSYLRLDGSVPPHQRHPIVTRFNNDVSIDLLLLTTAVGGLGLNLTGADTVIFVEHDWNPMKDVQAMDRAHRIGQRRVVNVYRLITRDTLEEKIMGLQKFKMVTANTVISSENAAIETMGTDQLLDLFQLSNNDSNHPSKSTEPANPHAILNPGPKSILDNLPDLWDDRQYEEEYDMTNFIKSLNKSNDK